MGPVTSDGSRARPDGLIGAPREWTWNGAEWAPGRRSIDWRQRFATCASNARRAQTGSAAPLVEEPVEPLASDLHLLQHGQPEAGLSRVGRAVELGLVDEEAGERLG